MAILALLQALFWVICANYLQENGFQDGSHTAIILSLFFLVVGVFLYSDPGEPKKPGK